LILGIESSFDDTCAAVVEGTGKVLANETNRFKTNFTNDDQPHAPLRAAQFHEENLPLVV